MIFIGSFRKESVSSPSLAWWRVGKKTLTNELCHKWKLARGNLLAAPVAAPSVWLAKAGAGLAGLVMIYVACLLAGRLMARKRSL